MVSIKLYAGTDIGLRDNNEDNFIVCPDLLSDSWTVPHTEPAMPLGDRGCLLVVSDGMGGQNAGEVASAITVDTVREMFSPGTLSDKVLSTSSTIRNYMSGVIKEADARVKKHGATHPDAEGLGATIVMAWVIGRKAYVAWMGDSRVYSLLPEQGVIRRLTKDHSYVQQLVDAGKLTDEEAMVHPNSNIITRSIGDTYQKAKPDTMEHDLQDGEMLLLCSDGLCGVCTDAEILDIVRTTGPDDLRQCKTALADAALEAGGSDNITVALLRVKTDNGSEAASKDTPATGRNEYVKTVIPERSKAEPFELDTENTDNKKNQAESKKKYIFSVIEVKKLSLLVYSVLTFIASVAVVTITGKCGKEAEADTADVAAGQAASQADDPPYDSTFFYPRSSSNDIDAGHSKNKSVDTAKTSSTHPNAEETYKNCHAVKDAIRLRIGERNKFPLLKADGNYEDGPKLFCNNRYVKISNAYPSENNNVTTFKYYIELKEGFKGPATISYNGIKIEIDTTKISKSN